MTSSLVGSEMCIRDSLKSLAKAVSSICEPGGVHPLPFNEEVADSVIVEPVSYTHLTLPTICSV
eukprot:9256254-Prorocentrum_lima.AAC.1